MQLSNEIRDSTSHQACAIVLLAHLMEKDGTLGHETRARADKAAEMAAIRGVPLLLMGWNYRSDTKICIADAIADYLRIQYRISKSQVFIDRRSRDTVGDAVFSKITLSTMPKFLSSAEVAIVTSCYHSARSLEVFRFVYGTGWRINVIGTEVPVTQEQTEHERRSLSAFRQTFVGIDSGDDQAILAAMIERHPYYNGEHYPAFNF